MDTGSQELDELCDKRSAMKRSYSEELSSNTMADPSENKCYEFYLPKRYILAFMAFLGFANVYALRVNLSVAMIAMNSNHSFDNSTLFENLIVPSAHLNESYGTADKYFPPVPTYHWDSELQGMILGSFFYGYIVTQIPGGYLANRFGGKYVFGFGILATGLLTLLTPACIYWNVLSLVILRIFEGVCEGVTYPSIHAMWANWAPPLEKTKLATIAFSGSYFGTVISLPVSAALARTPLGWPSIFYVWGSVAILWFVAWSLIAKEAPVEHKSISQEELEYIHQNIGYGSEQTKSMKPPWFKILSSLPVWAIVMAHFTENWGFYTWLTELPTFMHDILKFNLQELQSQTYGSREPIVMLYPPWSFKTSSTMADQWSDLFDPDLPYPMVQLVDHKEAKINLSQAGFLAALPYLVMGLIVIGAGQLADFLRRNTDLSTTLIRKMFTSSAFFIQAIFMVAAGYLMTREAGITCITIGVGIGGFAWAGFSVNHLDIAPQYASVLMGISNTFATLPGIISPSITGHIVSHQLASEWHIIFYIAAIIYLLGGMIYALCASGERQKWAEMPMGYLPYDDFTEPNQH